MLSVLDGLLVSVEFVDISYQFVCVVRSFVSSLVSLFLFVCCRSACFSIYKQWEVSPK